LFRLYEPRTQFFFYTLWARKAQADRGESAETGEGAAPGFRCSISASAPNQVSLTINRDAKSAAIFAGERMLLAVRMTYAAVNDGGGFLFRNRLRILAAVTGLNNNFVRFGVPRVGEGWTISTLSDERGSAIVTLSVAPETARLNVTGCEVHFAGLQRSYQTRVNLTPTPTTNADWQNGVALRPGPLGSVAGLIFDPTDDLNGIRPGTIITLHDGNSRIVAWKFANQVWLEGAPLNPGLEGYPNPVYFTLQ
jgi:hypothetical protein